MAGFLDPTFEASLTSLPNNYGTQTLDYTKNVLKGILYASLSVVTRTVTGQVKYGDGSNKAAVTSINIQCDQVITVNTGTLVTTGNGSIQINTNSSGVFQVTIAGSQGATVMVSVSGGVSQVALVGSGGTGGGGGGGGISGITLKDESSTVTGGPHSAVNFVGSGVSVADAGGGQATVTIPGGGTTYTAATKASDTFDRTNSSNNLGSTNGANASDPAAWTQHRGTWGIISNTAYVSAVAGGTQNNIATIDIGTSPNQFVQATISTLPTQNSTAIGVALGYADSNNFFYITVNRSSGGVNQFTIGEVVSGTGTTLSILSSPTPVAGDVIRLERVEYGLLRFYVNGTLVGGAVADGVLTNAARVGLYEVTTGGSVSNGRIENFSAGTLTATSSVVGVPNASSISTSGFQSAAGSTSYNLSTVGTIDWFFVGTLSSNTPYNLTANNSLIHKKDSLWLRQSWWAWDLNGFNPTTFTQTSSQTLTSTGSGTNHAQTLNNTTGSGYHSPGSTSNTGWGFLGRVWVPGDGVSRTIRVYGTMFDSNCTISARLDDGTIAGTTTLNSASGIWCYWDVVVTSYISQYVTLSVKVTTCVTTGAHLKIQAIAMF